MVKFTVEVHNSGSVGYSSRIRIDVYGAGNNTTIWSDKKALFPGMRKAYNLYWYAQNDGNYTARIRAYFGNEISEKYIEFQINSMLQAEDIFDVKNQDVRGDMISFDLGSDKSFGKALIIPLKYPKSWIIEETAVEGAGRVNMKFEPSLWYPTDLTLGIASDDGAYYSVETFHVERRQDIRYFIFYLIEKISGNVIM